jgi:hypothetical protein
MSQFVSEKELPPIDEEEEIYMDDEERELMKRMRKN